MSNVLSDDELKKEIWELYCQSRCIYHNNEYIYHNQTPLYPDFEHAIDYIKDAYPDLYQRIQKSFSKDPKTGKVKIHQEIAKTVFNDCLALASADYSSLFQIVVAVVTVIWNSLLLCWSQDNSENHTNKEGDTP